MTFNIAKIGKMWEKKGKIGEIWSMTKKRLSEIFAAKMEIFPPKNVIKKSWVRRKNVSSPQTRRQVSATGLRAVLISCSVICNSYLKLRVRFDDTVS